MAEDFTDFLIGAAIKDNVADLKRMNHYFESWVCENSCIIPRAVTRSP
jgi:hypothetical protein